MLLEQLFSSSQLLRLRRFLGYFVYYQSSPLKNFVFKHVLPYTDQGKLAVKSSCKLDLFSPNRDYVLSHNLYPSGYCVVFCLHVYKVSFLPNFFHFKTFSITRAYVFNKSLVFLTILQPYLKKRQGNAAVAVAGLHPPKVSAVLSKER